MSARSRASLRVVLCVAFIASLYGGIILLTAALFAMGFVILGVLSGLVLSGMTAIAVALFGLAWSMTSPGEDPDHPELSI